MFSYIPLEEEKKNLKNKFKMSKLEWKRKIHLTNNAGGTIQRNI
jgi:hypothetical protein